MFELIKNIIINGKLECVTKRPGVIFERVEKLFMYKDQYYFLAGIGTNGFIISVYPLSDKEVERLRRRNIRWKKKQ